MDSIKLICSSCGYIKEYINQDSAKVNSYLYTDMQGGKQCPICGAVGSMKMTKECKESILEVHIKEHILSGFKKFGIEGTIEQIDKATFTTQKEYYVRVITKHFRGLDKCFTK